MEWFWAIIVHFNCRQNVLYVRALYSTGRDVGRWKVELWRRDMRAQRYEEETEDRAWMGLK